MVKPRGEKAGGDLAVQISHDFAYEGKLSFSNLVLYRWDVAEAHPNGIVRDVLINYLCNCDAQYSSNTAVKEHL